MLHYPFDYDINVQGRELLFQLLCCRLDKQLEFDEALIVPTVLAALPFSVFLAIMCFQVSYSIYQQTCCQASH